MPQMPTTPELSLDKESINKRRFQKISISQPEDIVITYSWSAISHGICGHNFEAYEMLASFMAKNINDGKIKYLIPDTDEVGKIVDQAIKDKYTPESYNTLSEHIIVGKPTFLTAKTVILCDGCLPTKGIIKAFTLILILCSKESWWAKNIKSYVGNRLEIWYDERLDYDIDKIVSEIKLSRPDMEIKLRSTYTKLLNFSIYKKPVPIQQNDKSINFLVYATGNCRDIYLADTKYQSDSLKEIKDIISMYPNEENKKINLLVLGWNPNYNLDEKFYYQKHKDQKMFEDRRQASIMAEDLSGYFSDNHNNVYQECEVTIVPECDLPIQNILNQFDVYIYTPTEKNWDCSSRLIPECKHFDKELILTPTTKKFLSGNSGLRTRILDYFPELL